MALDWLLRPEKLWTREEVLASPSPVPSEAGIYGWYFRDPPPLVPLSGTHGYEDCHLLYLGICPKQPSAAGMASRRTLRHRLREHYRLNAYGSTLRLSLGCLIGLELRRISSAKNPGSATRLTFGPEGEARLNSWMGEHAFVVWNPCGNAWDLEHELLQQLTLPLNLEANSHSAFHSGLTQLRAQARERARALPPIDS